MKLFSTRDSCASSLLYMGFSLITFVFLNIFISSLLLVFKISITVFTPVVSFIITGILLFYLCRCEGMSVPSFVIILLLGVVIVLLCISLEGKITDCAYDADGYHKLAIGKLSEGWNPVYENLEEFDAQSDNSFFVTDVSAFWVNHYAKAPYFWGACIYKITGNIESAKSINWISLFSLAFLIMSLLIKLNKSPTFVVAFAAAVVTYPVFITQSCTNYVDMLLGVYLFLTLLCFAMLEVFRTPHENRIVLALLFMVLCIMINIKFSSFAYAGLFCMGYYIWYIVRCKKGTMERKTFVQFTITAAVAVLVGVFLIGLSVYPKNFIDHGHPFYPLYGEGKVDIMLENTPAMLDSMPPIQRLFYSVFAKSSNAVHWENVNLELKNLFTVKTDEYDSIRIADLRIGGHGVLFGGVLVLSLCTIVVLAYPTMKKHRTLFMLTAIPLAITTVMAFTMKEIWWARYFPQLFLFPLTALLYIDAQKGTVSKLVYSLLIFTVLCNNVYTFNATVDYVLEEQKLHNAERDALIYTVQNTEGTLVLSTNVFHGALYDVLDYLPEGTEYKIKIEERQADGIDTFALMNGHVVWSVEP